MDHGTWACPMPALAHEVKAAAWRAKADFDMVESNALPRRPSPLPGGERSDRACAIRVRGNRLTIGSAAPSPGMGAHCAHIPTSPHWGEVKSTRSTLSENALGDAQMRHCRGQRHS